MPETGVPYRFETSTLREVTKPSDYPQGTNFVIQIFETHNIHHEGDERSRTCPGHGYPAYTETIKSCRTFVTGCDIEWKSKLAELHQKNPGRTDVAAYTMNLAKVATRIDVEVSK